MTVEVMMTSKRRKNRINQTGRNDRPASTRFVRLDHALLKEPAYSALTPTSRSLLIELAMLENGRNNGQIWLSVTDAASRIGAADHRTAMAAFNQLEDLGFITLTEDAGFDSKRAVTPGRRARRWRLNWQPVLSRQASRNYVEKRPVAKADIRRMDRRQKALKEHGYRLSRGFFAGEDFAQNADFDENAGEDFAHNRNPNGGNLPNLIGAINAHDTAVPWGVGGHAPSAGKSFAEWWQTDCTDHLMTWASRLEAEIQQAA